MAADDSRGLRNYYEDQFGDRIRGICKAGSAPKPPRRDSGSAGGSSKGRSGLGFLVLVVVIGLFRVLSFSGSRHPAPPPVPRIHIPQLHLPADLFEPHKNWPQPLDLERILIEPRENGPERPGLEVEEIPGPKPDR